MKTLLWIDDYRNPFENDWLNFSPIGKNCNVIWVKSYKEAINWLDKNWPDGICFDHDLGEDMSGYDIAKFIVNKIIDDNKSIPKINCQSANPVGRKNIEMLFYNLNNFLKFNE